VISDDWPDPRDAEAWQQRFDALPEPVRDSLWLYAPTCHPGHPEAIAWAVIAAETATYWTGRVATSLWRSLPTVPPQGGPG
jgi:hypothetical protein